MNLLLPADLSEAAATALARQLLAALEANPVTALAMRRARPAGTTATAPESLALSGEGQVTPPPEGMPSFNRFIGVLTVPMASGITLDAVESTIRSVPGAAHVQVRPVQTFGIPRGEQPR